jgi:hypothetical protein
MKCYPDIPQISVTSPKGMPPISESSDELLVVMNEFVVLCFISKSFRASVENIPFSCGMKD